jgi:hypothetical protein
METRLRQTCDKSIRFVIRESAGLKPLHDYYGGAKEQDFDSRIYYEIARRRPSLLRPNIREDVGHVTLHSEFPINLLNGFADRPGELDLALVRQGAPKWRRDDIRDFTAYHEHFHDLIGVIETKRSFISDLGPNLERIRMLLSKFKDAFGILAVCYWDPRTEKQNNDKIKRASKHSEWRRMSLFCEVNEGETVKRWKGRLIEKREILRLARKG